MKSIMQEASTIAKAVEQGWIKAGKPKEFSVKVYEEPLTNFLGFAKKNAKVAVFFSERPHHGRDGRRPQKHTPQRRRFRHRRDDNRRDDRRTEGRRDEGQREKWYKPQEERQSPKQEGNQQRSSSGSSSKSDKKDTP